MVWSWSAWQRGPGHPHVPAEDREVVGVGGGDGVENFTELKQVRATVDDEELVVLPRGQGDKDCRVALQWMLLILFHMASQASKRGWEKTNKQENTQQMRKYSAVSRDLNPNQGGGGPLWPPLP